MEPGCRNTAILLAYCLLAALFTVPTLGGLFCLIYTLIMGLSALPGLALARRKAMVYSLVLAAAWIAGAVAVVARALSDRCHDESCIGLLSLGPILLGAPALLNLILWALRFSERPARQE